MAVVIRLQGLKITAGPEDIRSFFTGLRIPDGGVHIIGGELEEAFIIFVSDEDARRAMTRSGGCIKGSPVNLLLSSRSEMQKILEESAKTSETVIRRNYKEVAKRPAPEGRPPSLLDLKVDNRRRENPNMGNGTNDMRTHKKECSLYLYLSEIPFEATKEDVIVFFDGIQIDDIIFAHNKYGMFSGCALVKFRTKEDASEGLKRDGKFIGPRYIKVRQASEHQFIKLGGLFKPADASQRKHTLARTRSRSPIRQRSHSPSKEDFGVLYANLPYSVEKQHLKGFLHPLSLSDDQISIFVNDSDGSKSAIVIFRNLKDYCSGLAHHKEMFLHRVVYVSPVSKEKIATILKSKDKSREDQRRSRRSSEHSQASVFDSERRCIYVRNLPFDVRKVEIMDFFHGFHLSEDRVILLHDERGTGLGEALVVFLAEKEAIMAQSLNGQRFLGSEVMLKCITWAQMQEFGIDNSSMRERNCLRNSPGYGSVSNSIHDQTHKDICEILLDAPQYGPGCSGTLEHIENPDAFGQSLHGPGPQQYGPPDQQFDRPTCVRLLNLPSNINVDEIYDFCYGYRVVPGSVSLQYDGRGAQTGTATVVFESQNEAVTAVQELNGRPIGTRKINIVFV